VGDLMSRQVTKYIVIHCAATRASMDVGAKEIGQWHKQRGWSGIGYHFVIRRDGRVERGRAESAIGSHVAGHNSNTLGVCLVGGLGEGKGWPPENNFTQAQWAALRTLLREMIDRYPGATILGHRDFPGVAKACPSFDARAWAKANGLPAAPALRGRAAEASAVGLVSGGGSASIEEASTALSTNADTISSLFDIGTDKLTMASMYMSWAGKALAILSALAFAYALYRGARAAWRWWRGEGDFGQADDPIEAQLTPEEVGPSPRRKLRRRTARR
jgi:N-acetylmuramoyl-L-alanine amidase